MRTLKTSGLFEVEQSWRQYIATPANREWAFDSNLQSIRGMLGATNWRQVKPLGGAMSLLGEWYCTRALFEIFDGASDGWATMRRGLYWRYWGSCFDCEAHARRNPHIRGRPMGVIGNAEDYALLFAHACGTRDDEVAQWLGSKLLQAIGPEKEADWGLPFPEAAVRLYVRWKHVSADLSRHSFVGLGPYQAMLDTWDDAAEFSSALMTLCDYHCKYARGEYDEDSENPPAFGLAPYNLFPVDILVIQRIRTDQGLMTVCMHPLLDTPLYRNVPATPPPFVDPELQEVRSNFERLLALAGR